MQHKNARYMGKKHRLEEVSVEQSKTIYDVQSCIGNDLVLFDRFEDVPILGEAHRMNGVFVALCLDGTASYTVDDQVRAIQKNDILIISKGQMIGNYHLSPDCRGLAYLCSYRFFQEVIFNAQEISMLFFLSLARPIYNLDNETARLFVDYFQMVKQRVDDKNHQFRSDVVKSLIKSFIYDMGNVVWRYRQNSTHQRKSRAETVFFDFIDLVEKNFLHERRVSWYGKQLGISPKHLLEMVKFVSLRTPNEWIDNYVVAELRVQLSSTAKSIKQIADDMHFSSQSFLGKYFKEHVGISPTDYRNR